MMKEVGLLRVGSVFSLHDENDLTTYFKTVSGYADSDGNLFDQDAFRFDEEVFVHFEAK